MEYNVYSISINIPINHCNPEIPWNISIEKIYNEVKELNIEEKINPTLIFKDLPQSTMNQVYINLVSQSKPMNYLYKKPMYDEFVIQVLILYDRINKRKIAIAAFEVIDNEVQDKASIIWL